MAEVAYTVIKQGRRVVAVAWLGLKNGDTGAPYDCPGLKDKSVHVAGTFGTGGTVVIQGTNMETSPSWVTLADPQGNLLSFTTEKIEQILENTLKVRPAVTAGDATTNINVYLVVA